MSYRGELNCLAPYKQGHGVTVIQKGAALALKISCHCYDVRVYQLIVVVKAINIRVKLSNLFHCASERIVFVISWSPIASMKVPKMRG